MKVRLCYSKHYRHRVAHEVIAGPGYRLMSFVLWIKITVRHRVKFGETPTVKSSLLVRVNKGRLVPMTGAYMAQVDKDIAPALGWFNATIHSRTRGFETDMLRCGIHMASITIAMRHTQGVTMQYIALSIPEKAAITTRLAIASYHDGERKNCDLTP